MGGIFFRELYLDFGGVHGLLYSGIAQGLHLGVLDELLGTDGGAQAAVVALAVVDTGQTLLNGDLMLYQSRHRG